MDKYVPANGPKLEAVLRLQGGYLTGKQAVLHNAVAGGTGREAFRDTMPNLSWVNAWKKLVSKTDSSGTGHSELHANFGTENSNSLVVNCVWISFEAAMHVNSCKQCSHGAVPNSLVVHSIANGAPGSPQGNHKQRLSADTMQNTICVHGLHIIGPRNAFVMSDKISYVCGCLTLVVSTFFDTAKVYRCFLWGIQLEMVQHSFPYFNQVTHRHRYAILRHCSNVDRHRVRQGAFHIIIDSHAPRPPACVKPGSYDCMNRHAIDHLSLLCVRIATDYVGPVICMCVLHFSNRAILSRAEDVSRAISCFSAVLSAHSLSRLWVSTHGPSRQPPCGGTTTNRIGRRTVHAISVLAKHWEGDGSTIRPKKMERVAVDQRHTATRHKVGRPTLRKQDGTRRSSCIPADATTKRTCSATTRDGCTPSTTLATVQEALADDRILIRRQFETANVDPMVTTPDPNIEAGTDQTEVTEDPVRSDHEGSAHDDPTLQCTIGDGFQTWPWHNKVLSRRRDPTTAASEATAQCRHVRVHARSA